MPRPNWRPEWFESGLGCIDSGAVRLNLIPSLQIPAPTSSREAKRCLLAGLMGQECKKKAELGFRVKEFRETAASKLSSLITV